MPTATSLPVGVGVGVGIDDTFRCCWGDDEQVSSRKHGLKPSLLPTPPREQNPRFHFCLRRRSFAGLLVVVNKRVAYSIGLSHAFIFASGALLTAALLHIIPEAMEGLDSSYDNLHDLGLYAGLTVLGGLSVSIVIHGLMESGHSHSPYEGHSHGGDAETVRPGGGHGHHARVSDDAGTMMPLGLAEGDKVSAWPGGNSPQAVHIQADVTQPPSPAESSTDNIRALITEREGRSLLDVKGLQPVCWNVVIGDLVHNFADGVTIGAAFLTCSVTIGWTVTASAALHELPHEIADFMALLKGGMSLKQVRHHVSVWSWHRDDSFWWRWPARLLFSMADSSVVSVLVCQLVCARAAYQLSS